MHGNYIRTHWPQIRDQLKSKWGRLTDEDLNHVSGKWDDLLSILQERYGGRMENMLDEVTNFEDDIKQKIRNINV